MHIHVQYVRMTDQSCMFVYMYIILAYNSNICTYACAMCVGYNCGPFCLVEVCTACVLAYYVCAYSLEIELFTA